MVQTMAPSDLHELAVSVAHEDFEARFDEQRRLDLFRAFLDERSREMFERRALDQGWRQIAADLGYANAHSAEVQFRKKADRAVARIRARFGSMWDLR